jgi:hypothetical protein
VSPFAHIFAESSPRPTPGQPTAYYKQYRYVAPASGKRLAYSCVTFGEIGEKDDRFLHDGRPRGTSIPFNLGGDFEPVSPKIISSHARMHGFARTAERMFSERSISA